MSDDGAPKAVLPSVYLGSLEHGRRLPLLHSLGITAILIVRSQPGQTTRGCASMPAFPYAFHHDSIDIAGSRPNLIAATSRAGQFISTHTVDSPGKVLVYDDGDTQRAPAVLCFYAMERYAMSYQAAQVHVRESCHSSSPILECFEKQGLEFEAICRAREAVRWQERQSKGMLDGVEMDMDGDGIVQSRRQKRAVEEDSYASLRKTGSTIGRARPQ